MTETSLQPSFGFTDGEDLKLEAMLNSGSTRSDPREIALDLIHEIIGSEIKRTIADVKKYSGKKNNILPFFQSHMNVTSFLYQIGQTNFKPINIQKMYNLVTRVLMYEVLEENQSHLSELKTPDVLSRGLIADVKNTFKEIEQDIYFDRKELNQFDIYQNKAKKFRIKANKELELSEYLNQGISQTQTGTSYKEKVFLKYWLLQEFLRMKGLLQDEKIGNLAQIEEKLRKENAKIQFRLNERGGNPTPQEKVEAEYFINNLHPVYNPGSYSGAFANFSINKVPELVRSMQIILK